MKYRMCLIHFIMSFVNRNFEMLLIINKVKPYLLNYKTLFQKSFIYFEKFTIPHSALLISQAFVEKNA